MTTSNENASFQARVHEWLIACFGNVIASDSIERNHRFLEESLELVQACGCTKAESHQLVDYVFGRNVGEKSQEVGGVLVTLSALCSAQGLNMELAGETELARVWTKVEQIRAKQASKPSFSPLPGSYPDRLPVESENEELKLDEVIGLIIQDICELPDRTSPEDQPDLMLVTTSEMQEILERHLSEGYELIKSSDLEQLRAIPETTDGYVPKNMAKRLFDSNLNFSKRLIEVLGELEAARVEIGKLENNVMVFRDEKNLAIARWSELSKENQLLKSSREGWQLVPIEPTDEMQNSARDWSIATLGHPVGSSGSRGCYKSMLKVAPKPEEC